MPCSLAIRSTSLNAFSNVKPQSQARAQEVSAPPSAPASAHWRFRILHCLRAPVGGLFRHVLDLSSEQSAQGHDVGLIIDASTADRLTEQRLSPVAPRLSLGVARVPMSRLPGLGDMAVIRAVHQIARRQDAHVLHGHGAKGGAYARLAARALKREGQHTVAIYTPHGGSLHYPPTSAPGLVYLGIEKLLARCTDGLIFESDYMRCLYERRIGKNVAPAQVITNALLPTDFAPHEPAPDTADFLFVGELRRLKGVDVMLRALAEVARTRPVRAVIVGSGPDREAFLKLAAELDLNGIVTFTGAMPAARAFCRGRAIVVPSRAESLPYIVLEAAAASMPLIASEVGGIPEIVAGSDTKLLPPSDVPALVRAMNAFLDHPQAALVRAKKLRDTVQMRFAIDTTTAAVLDFYGRLITR
jgi:glycosyltransferase involved in cell wall biosynthesis